MEEVELDEGYSLDLVVEWRGEGIVSRQTARRILWVASRRARHC